MQDGRIISKLLLGALILLVGAAFGVAFLLEKNGNHAIFGIGTSITTAMVVGIVLMAPGAALVMGGFQRLTDGTGRLRASFVPVFWGLFVLCVAAVLFQTYFTFGMTLNLFVPKSALSWDIGRPMEDFFHEGEIIASVGYFPPEGMRDLPLLIHGPGRNLLPAWVVSNFGTPDTQVAQMRFITATGNFLSMLLASACALSATLIIASRQQLVVLGRAETLAYSALGVMLTMALVAYMSRVTNREVLFFAVTLVALLLIWTTASERTRAASILAVTLGALVMLSPLHTYLGSVQSALVALSTAVVALVISPGRRVRLLICGVLGAVGAFGVVSLLGGYWFFHDAVVATLYWSENSGPLWGRYAPRAVLAGALVFMGVGAVLGGFALAGKTAGTGDRAVRAVLVLLVVIVLASTFSYSNLSDLNHFGFGLYVARPAVAAFVTLLFVIIGRAHATAALVLGVVLAVVMATTVFTKEGSGILRAIAQLDTPDSAILPPAFYEITERFGAELAAQDCLLVMSNDGALAYLPRLPLCGTTFNPIHLTPEGDRELAKWLEANPQSLVVDGVPGHGAVGGPPMRNRLPLTYAVIDQRYPRSQIVGLWDIRLP